MKALVIEDSMAVRRIIQGILMSTCGFSEVIQKENGALGLEELLENHSSYDLAILDWQMPVMDGMEVLKKVREAQIKLPILVCTSAGKKESIIEAVTAGASDYLVKPFLAINLEKKIEKLFKGSTQEKDEHTTTALIVDESPIVRGVIKKILLKDHLVNHVVEASDGPSALKLFLSQKIDLLILDWQTSKLSGIEVIKAIRNENTDVPIIIAKENSIMSEMVTAFDAGVSGFIKKPYTHEELLAKVKETLEPAS